VNSFFAIISFSFQNGERNIGSRSGIVPGDLSQLALRPALSDSLPFFGYFFSLAILPQAVCFLTIQLYGVSVINWVIFFVGSFKILLFVLLLLRHLPIRKNIADQKDQFQGAAEALLLLTLQPGDRALPAPVLAEQDPDGEGGQLPGSMLDVATLSRQGRRRRESPHFRKCFGEIHGVENVFHFLQELCQGMKSPAFRQAGVVKSACGHGVYVRVDTHGGGSVFFAPWSQYHGHPPFLFCAISIFTASLYHGAVTNFVIF
jgi:hypothetical protein